MPAEVTAKLLELATYDVVFQKIESTQADTQILREVRQYRQYDKKDTNKGEFMQWNSEYPAKLSPITKEEVDHELALLPFRLDLQKIEAQKKAEQRRVLLEQHARNHADLEAEEVLQQQREAAIQRMILQFPQFPEIGDFLREAATQESDRKENKTIVDLQAQVLQLQAAPAQLQREIDALKAANTQLQQENSSLMRSIASLKTNKKWFGGTFGAPVAGTNNDKADERELRACLQELQGLSL